MTQELQADPRDAVISELCPFSDVITDGRNDRPPLTSFDEYDRIRQAGRRFTLGTGDLIYTRADDIRDIAQQPEIFHSKAYDPVTGEPAAFTLVPQAIDGPLHGIWRRLVGPFFAPGHVAQWEASARVLANDLIDDFIDDGRCDFIKQFSLRFPTSMFLKHVMGLPVDLLEKFLSWEMDIIHAKDDDPGAAYQRQVAAQIEVTKYFSDIIAQRRALSPEDRGTDLTSLAMSWKIDGEDVSDQDLLSFYLLMFMAGLDTVTAELGYGFHHLATHPADRDRLVRDPKIIPNALEELLRFYPIVNISRTAMADTEIDGCPVKAGQRFTLALSSAGRDDEQFEHADQVDFDRRDLSHITFGVGPHRCLGSHLARMELMVAYEEWHKRIPEYQLDERQSYDESQGGLLGLNSLPLIWNTDTTHPRA
ncbi:cytochrome P450 [Jatrophihabitans sp. DSM 45814]